VKAAASAQPPLLDRPERLPWLALLPALATCLFYLLPNGLQQRTFLQFIPQLLAYGALGVWAGGNSGVLARLGLEPRRWRRGLAWGIPTGLVLGSLNVFIILRIVPRLGGDVGFLRETPHAQMPVWLMLPWFILLIAVFVEVNFRGFLLGRLVALFHRLGRPGTGLAVLLSALAFAWDPFMVATFRSLHWIAVWDGLVWGCIWLHLRNLYATIAAHAVEVVVMYAVLKALL